MTRNEVLDRAEKFCKEHNITTYPVRIIELCEKYGFKVYERYMATEVSGIIIAQKENITGFDTSKLIMVNLSDSARRRRFTIAHELAHYILHKTDENQVFAHRDAGQTNSLEIEANTFASALLMPKKLIYDALSYLSDDSRNISNSTLIKYIADSFVVSAQAAQIRLEQLGVING